MTENVGEEPRVTDPRSSGFECLNCHGTSFAEREIKMSTTGMAIFDLEFLNKSARGYICQDCGFVHMFADTR